MRKALQERKETIHALCKEVGQGEKEVSRLEERLSWEKQKSESDKKNIRSLDEEVIGLYGSCSDCATRRRWSSRCNRWDGRAQDCEYGFE